jgi:N-acyl-D-aspartate/D-glutamate deacylase
MTSLPCDRFGLANRGRIQEGAYADLVLFDPVTIQDTATYPEPKQEPAGIEMVIVNGQVTLERGQHTGVGSGRMLRYRQE